MRKAQKIQLALILVSAVALAGAILQESDTSRAALILYALAYFAIGAKVLKAAATDLFHLQPLNENFLMTIATIGAAVLGEYSEAVAVMLFYSVGTLFEEIAVEKSRKSVSNLMDIRPDYATLYRKNPDGSVWEERKTPEEIKIGELIIIRPGELIPLDGIIVEGNTSLDMSPLTGESLPVDLRVGDSVTSGSINISGVIIAQTSADFEQSTVSKILDLVENASARKGKIERFITRFARIYTPIVVASALAIGIFPPLILPHAHFGDWLYRALIFLVVSCPCALVISIPLSFFAGIGKASALGILVKGGNYLEALAQMETVVFDKTGTLTAGQFTVSKIHIANSDFAKQIASTEKIFIAILAGIEKYSNHPLAEAVMNKASQFDDISIPMIENAEEIAGNGIRADVMNLSRTEVELIRGIAGNAHFMKSENVRGFHADAEVFQNSNATFIHLAVSVGDKDEYEYVGSAALSDMIKPEAKAALSELREGGVKETVMLSGDRKAIASEIAMILNITHYEADLLPDDKVAHIENMLKQGRDKATLAFVGDGINDAPALALADIGIAMGGAGSDAAIEAADVVIMNDELGKIAIAKRLALRTVRVAKQNVIFAIGIKLSVLILAATGYANMWLAIFADVGVAVLAILNSMRILLLRFNCKSNSD